MKVFCDTEASTAFAQILETIVCEPVVITRGGNAVAAIFSLDDARTIADGFLAEPIKEAVDAGKLEILDALIAQVDLDRRLEEGRSWIAQGNVIVADATYFNTLRDRIRKLK